ncbi:hypothetical protein EV195_10598 [Tenacibaculum skagerrakense]|uniref:Outer membrane protein with beta-barrel domain n=1 Tax=Tenacibaculum skagerrakense TaxID=186571 RepID=A0A4R2NS58_9FLAO|nr:hypothetical protein [Tenacibaculum skagerrakense]TCP24667.1 hypothetical protein EV195_10598 [Tenacibaculum skagerrakense]
MKKTLLSLLLLGATITTAFAQEEEKRQEVGINFSSLNSFGFTYKTGTSKNLWRFNVLALNINSFETENDDNVTGNDQSNIGAQISIGKEFRKAITKNLEFRYGFDVAFSYTHLKSSNSTATDSFERESTVYTPSVAGVIGVNYVFNDNLAFGVELLPRFSYRTGDFTETNNTVVTNGDISGYNFGFGNSPAQLSLSYRF